MQRGSNDELLRPGAQAPACIFILGYEAVRLLRWLEHRGNLAKLVARHPFASELGDGAVDGLGDVHLIVSEREIEAIEKQAASLKLHE